MIKKEMIRPSDYLHYLPAIYSEDEFWGRFLRIFEDIMTPMEEKIDQIEYYLDPRYAPPAFLGWLASWMDIELGSDNTDQWQRSHIADLIRLYRWRGTKRGIKEHINLFFGAEPRISETRAGMVLGAETLLGENTVLSARSGRDHFIVTLFVEEPQKVDKSAVIRIIEVHCPAHATYSLEILSGSDEV